MTTTEDAFSQLFASFLSSFIFDLFSASFADKSDYLIDDKKEIEQTV